MIEWINTNDKNSIAYKTGDFDGKISDIVLAKDKEGNLFLAYFNEGFIDGSNF